MGVLAFPELERRIQAGELIVRARQKNGSLDIQPASYDMTAGRAVWKDAESQRLKEEVYDEDQPADRQPTVCLEPGQMLSIVTHEEIKMPRDLCGMVYSKNGLALKGIFAFNAGHVDPGFEGPIVIRLINLRANQYTITLGQPIFTVVFERLDVTPKDSERLRTRPPISMQDTVKAVREFADVALSNALFDLYAKPIEARLAEHRSETLMTIRNELSKEFLRQDKLNEKIFVVLIVTVLTIVGGVAALVGIGRFMHEFGPRIWTYLFS
jgi:deoxycytidine triphosphate deaminase